MANDTNGTNDVFVRDLQLGTTTLVSINRFGTGSGDRSSFVSGISADGFRGIRRRASDLVANDTNGTEDVFVRDLQLGTTTLVSVNRFGTGSGNSNSWWPSDQRGLPFVAFQSLASDLVANDINGTFDVFVRDLQTGTTALVSINRFGTGSGNGSSGGPLARDQRGRSFRGVRACERLGDQTIPTVPPTCLCVLSRPEGVRNSGSSTGVAQSFTAPT